MSDRAREVLDAARRARRPAPAEVDASWRSFRARLQANEPDPLASAEQADATRQTRLGQWGLGVAVAALVVAVGVGTFTMVPSVRQLLGGGDHAAMMEGEVARSTGAVVQRDGVRAPHPAPTAIPPVHEPVVRQAPDAEPASESRRSSKPQPVRKPSSPRPAAPSPSEARPRSEEGLQFQVLYVRQAKGLLERGEPAAALRRLDQYRRSYPDGPLIREVGVLRAEALCALDRHTEARRAAQAVLARHPESALRPRLAKICPDGAD